MTTIAARTVTTNCNGLGHQTPHATFSRSSQGLQSVFENAFFKNSRYFIFETRTFLHNPLTFYSRFSMWHFSVWQPCLKSPVFGPDFLEKITVFDPKIAGPTRRWIFKSWAGIYAAKPRYSRRTYSRHNHNWNFSFLILMSELEWRRSPKIKH